MGTNAVQAFRSPFKTIWSIKYIEKMKYPPKHHQDNDINNLINVIKAYPLATIISVKDNTPLITHLPLIYNKENTLIGHIDCNNPQAELLCNDSSVTVIFSGPQCYISPSIYSTTQLPTWNYVKVHLKGTVKTIKDFSIVKQSMVDMTDFLEQPNPKYRLDINNSRMDSLVQYIKGFEVNITDWEGKFKLSQDKKPSDIESARRTLIKANQESIASFLDSVFK